MIHEKCQEKECANHGRYCRKPGHQKPKEKRRYLISNISTPRKDENKTYEVNKKKYLKEHAFCEAKLTGCTKIAMVIHHKKRRHSEEARINPKNFLAVCNNCHALIEADPGMAFKNKLSLKAID